MEQFVRVLSETHAFILSGEPSGYGWLLGIFVGLFYVSAAYMAWGAIKAILNKDAWEFINKVETVTVKAGLVAASLIPLLAILITYEVVSRYAFGAPTSWAFEISYMLMGISLMLGIAWCTLARKHIRVDFLYDRLAPKGKAGVDLAGFVFLLLPILIWVTWALYVYFLEAYKVSEVSGESAWNPLIWPFKFSFAYGFFLFTMQTIVEAIKCVLTLSGRDVPAPVLPKGIH
ncbi:MAG: TRAP-type mannitol/chloroaromatic compound transport system permease small subunit [Gammaproteobacteria bacterium]|jgi:TRAP-type mannitol/chloroaromatic compound transport system permease small subunit